MLCSPCFSLANSHNGAGCRMGAGQAAAQAEGEERGSSCALLRFGGDYLWIKMTRNEPLQQGVITKKNPALCCTYYFPRPPEITISNRSSIYRKKLPKLSYKSSWSTESVSCSRARWVPSWHLDLNIHAAEASGRCGTLHWKHTLKMHHLLYNSSAFIAMEKL